MSKQTGSSFKHTFENFRLPSPNSTIISSNIQPESYYRPNFILVSSTSKAGSLVFNDIFSVYRATEELTSIINASLEDVSKYFWHSRTFLICLLSFLYIILENTVYQTYLILSEIYTQVSVLPDYYTGIKDRIKDIILLFQSNQARELWWLELKIDLKKAIGDAASIIQTVLQIAQKFYMAVVVFLTLGILTFSSALKDTQNKPSSFLSRFLQNYSLNSNNTNNATITENSVILATSKDNQEAPIDTISEYTTVPNDTVESVAQLFGLRGETVTVNNKLSGDTLSTGQKLYMPFIDGYIISLDKDTSVLKLSDIAGVSSDLIINQNQNLFNKAYNNFQKDSLLLIPSADPAKVEGLFKANEEAEKTAAQIAVQAKQKQIQIAKVAIPVSINQNIKTISDDQAKTYGFKKPVGWQYVSRCFSSGHHGCDLVAPLGTPLYAAQKGVVVKVMNFDISGYGKGVVIDHGNGLSSLYAHMSKTEVSVGDIVSQGQKIGEVGDTGNATGYHCHFEIKFNGTQIDPWPFIGQ